MEGAVERVRRWMMTVTAFMAGLLAIMRGSGSGSGSEVMSRIAAPMVGAMTLSSVPTLGVIPALDALIKPWALRRALRRAPATPAEVQLAASGAE